MRPFAILAVLFILAEIVMISGCAKKESPTAIKPVAIQEAKEEPKPTQAQAIDAIRRSHPHSLQVCFDEVNQGFMIEYSILPDDAKEDQFMHGWKWLKFEPLHLAANGTWFASERAAADYVPIYPDVFNLPCKNTK
jgi:hypothetical protein